MTENRLLFVCTREGHQVSLQRICEHVPEPGGMGELCLDISDRVPISRDRMANQRRRLEGWTPCSPPFIVDHMCRRSG